MALTAAEPSSIPLRPSSHSVQSKTDVVPGIAQGRILFDIHIYPHEPSSSFLIDYDVRSPTPLVAHLKKFVLRSKVGLRDVSGEWDVWGAWGREPKGGEKIWKWGQGGSAGLTWMTEPERLANAEGEVGGWDLRADGMGWRGLVPKGEKRK